MPQVNPITSERTPLIRRVETPSLILRKARDADLPIIYSRVWQDDTLAEMMLWQPTKTNEEAKERMERTKQLQSRNNAWFVCLKETDEPIGFAGLKETEPGVFEETGICVCREYQRRGFGKELVQALVGLAFRCLGGKRFVYGCFRENTASAALCKSVGFTYDHSETHIRNWDRKEYVCDLYVLESQSEKDKAEP